ncbi:hypothetical protein V8G54_030275 [Vigna mungo]|uniref:Uncharacterized protein n=1 Tax=Vigna mungo TaxID=3915 RepID=A0AAQ3MUW4_VIGMU
MPQRFEWRFLEDSPSYPCHGSCELKGANSVDYGVVETERKDETTAFQTRHLYNKNGCISDRFRTGRLVKEFLEVRERGFKSVTELLECDISIGLDEHHTLLVAIHHLASVRTVLNPSSQRVVEN